MRKRYLFTLYLVVIALLLTGCEIDMIKLTRNPIVMVIIGAVAIWIAIKMKK